MKTLVCRVCGKVRIGVPRRQQTCSRVCGQRTPESIARNRGSGKRGGLGSGIARRKYAHTKEYLAGYSNGWRSGYARGYEQALKDSALARGLGAKRIA
jgi:hypothetical protein